MTDFGRRRLLQAGAAALLASGCAALPRRKKNTAKTRKFHVAIVGGGYAGASTARFLKEIDPAIRVTLVEYNKVYATAPASNWVIGGLKPFPAILTKFRKLAKLGVKVIHDWVTAVDVAGKNLRFDNGSRLGYDRLVLAPGIAMDWQAIDGYDEKTAELLPHGWIPGLQTQSLSRQLKEMRAGGVYLLSRPEGDISCPQALYERASLVANYLVEHNPAGKLLLLDAHADSTLRTHFKDAWETLFGFGKNRSQVELIDGRDARVLRVDAVSRAVFSGAIEERHRADLVNIIPPQKAGVLAQAAGLVDASGWCPVHPVSGESTLIEGIHVVGDAADTGLDRHAGCANQLASLCAHAIAQIASEQAQQAEKMRVVDTVDSLSTSDEGFSRTRSYQLRDGLFVHEEDSDLDGVSRGKEAAEDARRRWKTLRKSIWG